MNYEGYLICTDMDGTFSPTDENFEAIKYFQDHGGKFTLATGRNISYIDEYFSPLPIKPNAPAVMCNGSVIYDYATDKILCENFLKPEDYKLFIDIANKFDVMVRFAQRASSVENENIFASDPDANSGLDINHLYKGVWHSLDNLEPIEKYMFENYSDKYQITKSCKSLIEANPKGISKSWGTLYIKEYTKSHTLICVGDYGNDIPMLKTADISYAVENATEEVKNSAMRVTVKNTESALAKIIEEIGRR